MVSIVLKVIAVVAGVTSAVCWLYGAKTVSREKELLRRQKKSSRTGEPVSLAGVEILDGDARYDLIATLRHQSVWNRAGAIFAAIAVALQAIDLSIAA